MSITVVSQDRLRAIRLSKSRSSAAHTCVVLTAVLFDKAGSSEVEDFTAASQHLSSTKVLWINLQGPSDSELREIADAFAIESLHSDAAATEARVQLLDEYIHVDALFPPDTEVRSEDSAQALSCYIGHNWLITRYQSNQPIVEEFRELATGPGAIGGLEAMSLLATLLEHIIVGYSEAFEEIEERLEGFDEKVLASSDSDIESNVALLVEARARVGLLRRALAPHRRVFTTLSHTELDAVSTENSAQRFTQLAEHVKEALNGARDAREAVVNSFDMLILRTEHRTNEIVKVLTLASILFLPGALVAGIMGMNVDIPMSDFVTSSLFWGALALMALIAGGTLILAKVRRWI